MATITPDSIRGRLFFLESEINTTVVDATAVSRFSESFSLMSSFEELAHHVNYMAQTLHHEFKGNVADLVQAEHELEVLRSSLETKTGSKDAQTLLKVVHSLKLAVQSAINSQSVEKLSQWSEDTATHIDKIEESLQPFFTEDGQKLSDSVYDGMEALIVAQLRPQLLELINDPNIGREAQEAWVVLFIYKMVFSGEPGSLASALIKALDPKNHEETTKREVVTKTKRSLSLQSMSKMVRTIFNLGSNKS